MSLFESCQKEGITLTNNNLWRYITNATKDAIGRGEISWLCLRKNDNGYLSFSHSNETTIESQLIKIHENIKLKKEDPAVYLYFDYEEALEQLNKNDKMLIKFESKKYPHIGLIYLCEINLNTLTEINAVLSEIATFTSIDDNQTVIEVGHCSCLSV